MKTDEPKDKKELIRASRIARQEPGHASLWEQIADYFDSRRKKSEELISPRPIRETE